MLSDDGDAPVIISEQTAKFLSHLHGYLDTRKKMDAKYKEDDPDGLLENFDVGAECAKPAYTKELQQQSIKGEPVQDMDELYEAAELARPVYERIVQKLVDQVHTTTIEDDDDDEVVFAPLKGRERAKEKADNDYVKRAPGPGVSWLFDIVRGSIKFASTGELMKCMELLKNPESDEYRLVKAKNRFQNPTLSGYRDFNVCIQITVPNGSGGTFQHICELQIHHIAIKSLSKELHSHHYYEFFRTYFEGATASLTERMAEFEYLASGAKLDAQYLTDMVTTCTDEMRLFHFIDIFREYLSEYDLAIKASQRLLEIRKDKPHAENELPGTAYLSLGTSYQFKKESEKALENYRKYIDIRQEVFGPDDEGIADASVNMGLLYDQNLGRPEEGYPFYVKAEEIYLKAEESHTDDLMTLYSNMSSIYQKRGEYDTAVKMCEKSRGLAEKLYGPEHYMVGVPTAKIGEFRHKQGKFDEAIELYKNAEEIFVRSLGPHHPYSEQTKLRLSQAEAGTSLDAHE